MLEGITAVIFDLDGTLIDSMWMWREIDIEYLGRFHIEIPENLQRLIEGKSFSETAVYFKERFGIEDSLEAIKQEWNAMAWYKYGHEVKLKPGVAGFLEKLKARGILMGIATSNSRELAEMVIKVHNIQSYFDVVVTGCDVETGKPAPDVYLKAALDLNAAPENCLVFEDIPNGIIAGKRAGMRVCAVEDDYSADLLKEKKALADYYIDSYEGLL